MHIVADVHALDSEHQLDAIDPRVFATALRRVSFEPPLTVAPHDIMFQQTVMVQEADVIDAGRKKKQTATKSDKVYHHNHRILRQYSNLIMHTIANKALKLGVKPEDLKNYYMYLLRCDKRLPARFELSSEHVINFLPVECL